MDWRCSRFEALGVDDLYDALALRGRGSGFETTSAEYLEDGIPHVELLRRAP